MATTKKNTSTKKSSNVSKETKIDFKNLSDEQILGLDLDTLTEAQILDLLSNNKAVESFKNKTKNTGADGIYKKSAIKESEDKKRFRQRIRKERNSLLNTILVHSSDKDKTKLKSSIEAFNKFYKNTYILNDYSQESIARKNSDKDTLAMIKLAFTIIKLNK